jgi:hypothetical protein
MGTLKAKVAGVWTPVSGNGQSAADVAKWNSAGGFIGATAASDLDVSSTSPTVVRTMTVGTTTGRQYALHVQGLNSYFAGGAVAGDTFQFDVTLDGVIFSSPAVSVDYGGNYIPPGVTVFPFTAPTGSHVLGLQFKRISGSGLIRARYSLMVYDQGPVTQVAIAPPAATPRIVSSGNALGIIAMGAFIPPYAPRTIAVNTETALTYPLPFFALVGRRYRVRFQVRAIANSAGAGNTSFYLRDNGTNIRGHPLGGDPYLWNAGAYTGVAFDWLFDGDGLQHSLELLCNGIAMSVYTDYGLWYVEDVGPNSGAALPIPETPQSWTPLPFAAGWRNYQGGTTVYGICSYRKIGDVVTLRGLAEADTSAGTITPTIANLPVGFRPPADLIFKQETAIAVSRVDAVATGLIRITGTAPASGTWVSLVNISFSTTP